MSVVLSVVGLSAHRRGHHTGHCNALGDCEVQDVFWVCHCGDSSSRGLVDWADRSFAGAEALSALADRRLRCKSPLAATIRHISLNSACLSEESRET